jgi:hypothetical protein
VEVLMRASFIIALEGFWNCTWRNFQSSWHFPYWLTFMSSSNDGLSFLFAYLRCSCHNMELVFYQIALSFVYHSYLVTTIGSKAIRRKGTPVNCNAFQLTTSWIWLRVSRLPLKSVPLLVRAAFGGRRHRFSSHRRSTFHFSICLVLFSYTPGFKSLSIRRVYNPLFPPMSVGGIVCCFVYVHARLVCTGLCQPILCLVLLVPCVLLAEIKGSFGYPTSALLCLTPLQPGMHTEQRECQECAKLSSRKKGGYFEESQI